MQMYAVSRQHLSDGTPKGSIIELSSIIQPCYLLPRFKTKKAVDLDIQNQDGKITEIDGDNCLALVDDFWINSFQNQITYQTVF